MRIDQLCWRPAVGWHPEAPTASSIRPQPVLTLGGPPTLALPGPLNEVSRAFPNALHFGCSAAGGLELLLPRPAARQVEAAASTLRRFRRGESLLLMPNVFVK